MNKSDIKCSADMFLYKAIIDLNSGKYLLDAYHNEEIAIDIDKVYFELQQCGEKLLKSMLSQQSILFPKTHDIERLIALCQENSIELIDDIECLIELNDYAVEGRYSIIHDDISDAREYIEVLEKLLEHLKVENRLE